MLLWENNHLVTDYFPIPAHHGVFYYLHKTRAVALNIYITNILYIFLYISYIFLSVLII